MCSHHVCVLFPLTNHKALYIFFNFIICYMLMFSVICYILCFKTVLAAGLSFHWLVTFDLNG